MRKIKNTNAYSKIYNIRINVFQSILSQIINGDFIDLTSNKYLKRILDLRSNKKIFNVLIQTISKEEAKRGLELSIIQDNEIEKGIFSIKKEKVPESVEKFVEFIYDNIIFNGNYWDTLGEGEFSKMIFKKDFFDSQGHCVCPYCDGKEDLELLEFQLDHFLPKSVFPLLYINEKNLIPCCMPCNHKYYGKGDRWKDKYYNLFKNIFGEKVEFLFEPDFKINGIDTISGDFLNLIQLDTRMNKDNYILKINKLKKKIFLDLKKDKDNETFMDFSGPDYFLSKAIYKYWLDKIK